MLVGLEFWIAWECAGSTVRDCRLLLLDGLPCICQRNFALPVIFFRRFLLLDECVDLSEENNVVFSGLAVIAVLLKRLTVRSPLKERLWRRGPSGSFYHNKDEPCFKKFEVLHS